MTRARFTRVSLGPPYDVTDHRIGVADHYVKVYGMPSITARRASLATNMRLQTSSEILHRPTRPGQRTACYRVDDDAWEYVIRRPPEVMEWTAEALSATSPGKLDKSLAEIEKRSE